MAAARDSFSRLNDDVLTLVFELVGPDGMFDDRRVEHLRRPQDLAPAQRDLHRFRRIARRIGAVAGAVAEKHLGTSTGATAVTDSQSSADRRRANDGWRLGRSGLNSAHGRG